MKKYISLFLVFIFALSLVGCEGEKPPVTGSEYTSYETVSVDAAKTRAEEVLSGMTLEQKIAQLFITDVAETPNNFSDSDCLGGYILFADSIQNPEQLKELTKSLKEGESITPFVSVDEEGGRVARLANNPAFGLYRYKSMYSVGSSGDTQDAYNVGNYIGGYLKEYGFSLNLAPIGDIFTNPVNTVIAERAFGSDAETVSKMVNAAIDGFHSRGIMTAVKHFPGHGDTFEDSHNSVAVSRKALSELETCELIPFANSVNSTDMIMTGHIALPTVTGNMIPASLSYEITTGILREKLGFEGVIITDSLSMEGITKINSSAEAALMAINAGADILFLPESFSEAYSALLSAVQSGKISEERINQSVMRILTLKAKYGMI